MEPPKCAMRNRVNVTSTSCNEESLDRHYHRASYVTVWRICERALRVQFKLQNCDPFALHMQPTLFDLNFPIVNISYHVADFFQ
ncbi:hypothetical protein PsorP6_001393 [Peronosclerospora sorghi]|uniref:Uncharacterized protein n=1 Tax=Peronosclerospora sorghi TaxID=230839 RepID=A0ACC0WWS4_9STRA|nr:hypothetical protein PsorP6_001393 [Peronosclerospora sorghi]